MESYSVGEGLENTGLTEFSLKSVARDNKWVVRKKEFIKFRQEMETATSADVELDIQNVFQDAMSIITISDRMYSSAVHSLDYKMKKDAKPSEFLERETIKFSEAINNKAQKFLKKIEGCNKKRV